MTGTSVDLARLGIGDRVAWMTGRHEACVGTVVRFTATQIIVDYRVGDRELTERWYRKDGSRVGNRFDYLLDPLDPIVIEALHISTARRALYDIEIEQRRAGRLVTGQAAIELLRKVENIAATAAFEIKRREARVARGDTDDGS